MRHEALEHLACPACGAGFDLQVQDHEGDHVMSGSLTCSGCGALYPVARGVPRMNRAMENLGEVARAFSYEWGTHQAGKLEDQTLFGRTEAEDWELFRAGTRLSDDDLKGAVALDAGCGAARMSRQIADRGARAVIALDMSESVDGVFRQYADVPNLHVVQGNLMQAPARREHFDLVWSNGVIHHTPDARAAFNSLTRHVHPGGVLYVWVYPDRFNPFRYTKRALDGLGLNHLSEPATMRLASAFAYISVALLAVYRAIRSLPGLRPTGRWGENTVRRRGLRELQLTWNDALAPRYNSWHTDAEVLEWFHAAGFVDAAAVDEPKVGVSGRAPAAASRTAG